MGLTTEKKVTFKPLKRQRYRCNQTGEIVKKTGIEGLTRRLLNQTKRSRRPGAKEFSVFTHSNHVICPKCKRSVSHDSGASRVICPDGHTLIINQRSRFWNNYL
jgi:hypothetical protein